MRSEYPRNILFNFGNEITVLDVLQGDASVTDALAERYAERIK